MPEASDLPGTGVTDAGSWDWMKLKAFVRRVHAINC